MVSQEQLKKIFEEKGITCSDPNPKAPNDKESRIYIGKGVRRSDLIAMGFEKQKLKKLASKGVLLERVVVEGSGWFIVYVHPGVPK